MSPSPQHKRRIYVNPDARNWSLPTSQSDDDSRAAAQDFHQRHLPGFKRTPLIPLEDLARELGVKKILVKDESSRMGLPAFKVLGASWGVFRAVADRVGYVLENDNYTLDELSTAAKQHGIKLFTATAGNHGRAVARIGSLLHIPSEIFVPDDMYIATQELIASEGANVTVVQGDYIQAVFAATRAMEATQNSDGCGILVQDNSWEGYEQIPQWIVDGYSTMFYEIEAQLSEDHQFQLPSSFPILLITPFGIGSLAEAAVIFSKSRGRHISVLAVEPETAASLHTNLERLRDTVDTSSSSSHEQPISITTSTTIMAGMNCATVSPTGWPIFKHGIDVCVTVTDKDSHADVIYLQAHGVNAGPCGGATVAALRRTVRELSPNDVMPRPLLGPDSVIVLLSTEGARKYPVPTDQGES